MKIGFLLRRNNWIRTLAPIIEAAFETEGVEPEIILFSKTDPLKPGATKEALPATLRDSCPVMSFQSTAPFQTHINALDAVVTIVGPSWFSDDPAIGVAGKPLWCVVFDARHSTFPTSHFDEADLMFWPTPHSLDEAVIRGVGTRAELMPRSRFVGITRTDALFKIDEAKTLEDLGLDPTRPVASFIPDPYRIVNMDGGVSDWYQQVWCVEGTVERLARALVFRRNLKAIREALETTAGQPAILKSVRAFCDRNDAQLVLVPRREKNVTATQTLTPDELAVADFAAPRGDEYPSAVLRALKVSDLMVCPYTSHCAIDSIAAGIPYITIVPPKRAYAHETLHEQHDDFVERHQGEEGAVWMTSPETFVESFPSQTFSDYQIDPKQLEKSQKRHLGLVDGGVGRRILDEIKTALKA